MKIFKNADMVCDNERVYYGAKLEDKSIVVSIQAYGPKCAYTVELSSEEVAKMISLLDFDTLRPVINKMEDYKRNELRKSIRDDMHYIMDKMDKSDDFVLLTSVFEKLENITAEI